MLSWCVRFAEARDCERCRDCSCGCDCVVRVERTGDGERGMVERAERTERESKVLTGPLLLIPVMRCIFEAEGRCMPGG